MSNAPAPSLNPRMEYVMNQSKYIASAIAALAAIIGMSAFAGEPTFRQGKDIFIETGVDGVDRSPTWYAPMANKP